MVGPAEQVGVGGRVELGGERRQEPDGGGVPEPVGDVAPVTVLSDRHRPDPGEAAGEQRLDRDVDHDARRAEFVEPVDERLQTTGRTGRGERRPVEVPAGIVVDRRTVGHVGREEHPACDRPLTDGNEHRVVAHRSGDRPEPILMAPTVVVHVVADPDHAGYYPSSGTAMRRVAFGPRGYSDVVDRDEAGEMFALGDAATSDEIVLALCAVFGEGSEVYAVDHAADALHHYGDLPSVGLQGAFRSAVFALESVAHGDRWWMPLAERDQPIFVVSAPERIESIPSRRVVGALMGVLRTRFEPLERIRRRDEMSVAAELQWDLLPVRADHGAGLSVAATLEPSYDVAGDLFDYAFDDGLWVYSLDGMGHGLSATTTGCVALAAIRNERRRSGGLVDQFTAASRAVRELTGGRAFVTAVGCRIAPDGSVAVVNAGHETIRRVDADGGVDHPDIAIDRPLGVGPPEGYRIRSVEILQPGEGLLLVSDGAAGVDTEAGTLGAERLDRIIGRCWDPVALRTVHAVSDAVLEASVEPLGDDVTVVAIRRDDRRG